MSNLISIPTLRTLLASRRRIGLIFQGDYSDDEDMKTSPKSADVTVELNRFGENQGRTLYYVFSAEEFKRIYSDTKLTGTDQIVVILASKSADETKAILAQDGMSRRIQMTLDLDAVKGDSDTTSKETEEIDVTA